MKRLSFLSLLAVLFGGLLFAQHRADGHDYMRLSHDNKIMLVYGMTLYGYMVDELAFESGHKDFAEVHFQALSHGWTVEQLVELMDLFYMMQNSRNYTIDEAFTWLMQNMRD